MHDIIIQRASRKTYSPSVALIRKWANMVLDHMQVKDCEVTFRIVSAEEITMLNGTYRQKQKPTNVLSFPCSIPDDIKLPKKQLGDIALCSSVINQEALVQKKTKDAHWAHLVVHGLLHLLGHDHEEEHDAIVMEKIEIEILNAMGHQDPYQPIQENSINHDA